MNGSYATALAVLVSLVIASQSFAAEGTRLKGSVHSARVPPVIRCGQTKT
jgi:hypothetical protein